MTSDTSCTCQPGTLQNGWHEDRCATCQQADLEEWSQGQRRLEAMLADVRARQQPGEGLQTAWDRLAAGGRLAEEAAMAEYLGMHRAKGRDGAKDEALDKKEAWAQRSAQKLRERKA